MANDIVFGCSKRSDAPDDHVEDLWAANEADEYHSIKKAVLEAQSKLSKPLLSFPEFMKDSGFRHGVMTSKSNEDAKKLIYANENCEYADNINTKPWSQRRRNYNWPTNPETMTFGIKSKGDAGTTKGGNGAGVAEALCIKDESDALDSEGKSHDPYKIFGKPTSSSCSSTAECLGHTKSAQNGGEVNDIGRDDIGKSLKPGYRNVLTTRCFGCPSIRTDIPNHSRSVADTQNYGDSIDTRYLLRPSLFSSFGLEENEFLKPRSKEYLKKLFPSCGEDTFEEIFDVVSDRNNCASIQSIKDYNKK
ncbi:hypothetical protein ACHAW5_001522 [Stephanodiscus triporus]|uniref:EFHB C-terminal EF-hand domain-containing protein n=1 Tax=Stephanodiscus triporus TaxID=2934178 RepID=A0ABD3NZT0_9STRA